MASFNMGIVHSCIHCLVNREELLWFQLVGLHITVYFHVDDWSFIQSMLVRTYSCLDCSLQHKSDFKMCLLWVILALVIFMLLSFEGMAGECKGTAGGKLRIMRTSNVTIHYTSIIAVCVCACRHGETTYL